MTYRMKTWEQYGAMTGPELSAEFLLARNSDDREATARIESVMDYHISDAMAGESRAERNFGC